MTDKQWQALQAPIELWAQAIEKWGPGRPALSIATETARHHVVELFSRMQDVREIRPGRKFHRIEVECFMSGRGSGWALEKPRLRDSWFEAAAMVEAAL